MTEKTDQEAREAAARAERDIAFAKAREAAAAQLERDRAAAEAKAKAADTRRAADQAHRERIHAEIAEDLVERGAVLDRNTAKTIATMIAYGFIRHLTINY